MSSSSSTRSSADDIVCNQKLSAARLKIRYNAASDGSYPAKAEARALTTLSKQTPELWPLYRFQQAEDRFRRGIRPFDEVRVATWLRAVYSKWQLRKVLVDFWHNHFNVNGSGESQIYATFPVYDRDVIRKNCLGNFRTFLEDVAKSTAMMYYLDNYNNKVAGGEGGNENYARELFELHHLGSITTSSSTTIAARSARSPTAGRPMCAAISTRMSTRRHRAWAAGRNR